VLTSMFFKHMYKGKTNKVFIWMLMFLLLNVFTRIVAVNVAGNIEYSGAFVHFIYGLNLLLSSGEFFLFANYIIALTDIGFLIRRSRFVTCLVLGPMCIDMLLLFINIFYRNVFFVDFDNEIVRCDMFFLLYVCSAYYVILSLFIIIKYNYIFDLMRYDSLLLSILAMAAVNYFAFFSGYEFVELFTKSIVFLFVLNMVQRPEDMVDSETGFGRYNAYMDRIKRSSYIGKNEKIIFFNIVNYTNIRIMIDYQERVEIKKLMVQKIEKCIELCNVKVDEYYLGTGRFRIFMNDSDSGRIDILARELREAFKSDIVWKGMNISTQTALCIVNYPQDIEDKESLAGFDEEFNMKDYENKIVYAKNLFKKEKYNIIRNMDYIIERAISERSFEVYYQPIYSIKEGKFNSAEALIRLEDKDFGFISPELMIPAAEKSGAIHKIGAVVFEKVCEFIKNNKLKELGIDYIEINLSVSQCMEKNLPDKLMETIKKYDISPDMINLEITETVAGTSQKSMADNINKLHKEGFSFSLDDFGTGYSNMRRIASLPFAIVKIDKTLTKFKNNPNLEIIIENTINMIKAMNMKIVVEGIETKENYDNFARLNCEYIQGYYFSKPVKGEEFIKFIKDYKG